MAEYSSPQTSPYKGKLLKCTVLMLDDTNLMFPVPMKSNGQYLFDSVVRKLQLLEADYFDLEYTDDDLMPCWLDREKLTIKQVARSNPTFRFLVKFYTPDPGLLEEELTRYLFALQIKRDLASGVLFCQEHTAVLMASYVVQAEVGNYCDELADQDYLSTLKILPNQSREIELKIMEHHREHFNQAPGESDFNLLDTARKVEFYGMHLHPAKDHEGINLHLAVAHMGIVVFQNFTKINAFSWAKIRKLCFKRKKFMIKLHPENYAYNKDIVEFYFPSRNWSKNFWKRCIEHHAFFRCHSVRHVPRNKSKVVSRGSSFRYSGKTQKELVEFVRENFVQPAPFERSASLRTISVLNSRTGTPRAGTLGSRSDFHYGAQHASFSSGSRTLERSQPGGNSSSFDHTVHINERDEFCGVGGHNDPSQNNGTFRSFHIQKNSNSFDAYPQRGVGGPLSSNSMSGNNMNGGHQSIDRIDPSLFMLSNNGHRTTSPLAFTSSRTVLNNEGGGAMGDLRYNQQQNNNGERLRSMDNISRSQFQSPSLREIDVTGMSAALPQHNVKLYHQNSEATTVSNDGDCLPLPPPPPLYDDSLLRQYSSTMLSQGGGGGGHGDTFGTRTSKSTTSAASVTLTSNPSIMSSQTDESEDESRRRQRFANDRNYYLAKELLMTERTYKKDLDLITQVFHDTVVTEDALPPALTDLIFNLLTPLYEFHSGFLRDIEQRLAIWEGKTSLQKNNDSKRIGDLLVNMSVLQQYRNYLEHHEEILLKLDVATRRNKDLEHFLDDFEARKSCYLPLNAFFLKPVQRLLHYKLILEKLLKWYRPELPDVTDCKVCLEQITDIIQPYEDKLTQLVNWQKLNDLQRDLSGIDNLVQPGRLFIREGCLQKLSRKGYQQRMFFLFSDVLLYTSRTASTSLQFKVHGQLLLRGMSVEETDSKMATSSENSFTIYSSNSCLIVAASSAGEKDKWVDDLQRAIQSRMMQSGEDVDARLQYASLKSNSSSEALDDSRDDMMSLERQSQLQHRANTVMHVCWHRSTSVGINDHHVAVQNQLSGYLLRKFKNSNGWQKLWVVFSNFCLFFYKSYQDDSPLASLPLLGYSICIPNIADGIHKDFVFKLQFKNHVYFFRAESEATFERWMDVIGSVTSSSRVVQRRLDIDPSEHQLPPLPPLPGRHQF